VHVERGQEDRDLVPVARRPAYYTKPEEDALILWLNAENGRS
jgi:hypothetical protein